MPRISRQPMFTQSLTLATAAVLLVSSHLAAQPAGKNETARDAFGPVGCAAFSERLTHPRWLSLPMSRLAVNPTYTYSQNVTPQFTEDVLPLDLAYYVGAAPARLPAFLAWQLTPNAASEATRSISLTREEWLDRAVTARFGDGQARLSPTANFGCISKKVTVDLERTPDLLIQVPVTQGAWAVKVKDGGSDVTLIADTSQIGDYLMDVPARTGWHGAKTFTLEIWAIGGPNKVTTVSGLQFFAPPQALGPRRYVWAPQQVIAYGSAGDGTVSVEATTGMPDENTVSQCLRVVKIGTRPLRLMGQFNGGNAVWDEDHHILRLQSDAYHAVLAFSRPIRWLGVRASSLAWRSPASGPETKSGVWCAELDGLKAGDLVVTSTRFAPTTDMLPEEVASAQLQATPATFAAAMRRSEAAWDKRLALVPRPRDFTPRRVDANGVTAADVRRSYYRAWAFFFQDTLPPMPENGFPYPQVCTGKPSLWTDGGTHTEETALWDSAAAMQALTLVQPQLVWMAAQGIMSQVDADGYLNGEALPTIFSRTLWLLYEQTGDADNLRAIYPALRRFLAWKIANPRWVYPNRTKPAAALNALKDQEYVSHEIVDLDYAIKITNALGMPDEATRWRQEQQNAAADYRRWFWPAPGGTVYQIYVSDTNRGSPDNPWSLQGLQISPSLLPPEDSRALLTLYKKTLNPALPFLVPGRTRFGDLNPIARGLFRHGQVTEAAQLMDACLRDVTRAGEFSENYAQVNPPTPGGVCPSAFGARLMTDSVFWHNGVVLDEGLPVLLGLPGAAGVDNVPIHGDPINIRFDTAAHTVTLTGPGLSRLRLPQGFHSSVAHRETVWTGPIAEGQQIHLEEK